MHRNGEDGWWWWCVLTGHTSLSAFRRDTVQSRSVCGFFKGALQPAGMAVLLLL